MESDSDYLTDGDEIDDEGNVDESAPPSQRNTGFGERHLLDLKQSLGLDTFAEKRASKSAKRKRQKERRKLAKQQQKEASSSSRDGKLIETVATRNNDRTEQPEVVEYKDPRKRKSKESKMAIEDNDNTVLPDTTSTESITTMKEARFDVFKFGVKGFDKEGQLSAREALAIRLGAKPAKQKGMPYKEYKAKMRDERAKETEAKQERKHQLTTSARSTVSINQLKKKGQNGTSSKFGSSKPQSKNNKRRKNGSTGGSGKSGIQPQMGRFDGGMLKLSAKEIAAMKSKK